MIDFRETILIALGLFKESNFNLTQAINYLLLYGGCYEENINCA